MILFGEELKENSVNIDDDYLLGSTYLDDDIDVPAWIRYMPKSQYNNVQNINTNNDSSNKMKVTENNVNANRDGAMNSNRHMCDTVKFSSNPFSPVEAMMRNRKRKHVDCQNDIVQDDENVHASKASSESCTSSSMERMKKITRRTKRINIEETCALFSFNSINK